MGLFNRKADPITERAKALNEKIAALEAEIKKLSETPEPPPAPVVTPEPVRTPAPAPATAPVGSSARPASPNAGSQPRLRSTALPHRQAKGEAPASHEPIFEELNQPQIKAESMPPPPAPPADLGMRKSDFASGWQRFTRHFRGPMTSNPKLVSYLAAGSIQGLQPLRYEKRVARNRFIVLVVCLALALWGIIAILR
jgi:hypothetical protein